MGLKGFPAPKYHYFLLKMAPSTYFFELNSKTASKITLGHSLNFCDFWRAKSEKWKEKISKIFIVPNRPKYHTDQLYTYKGYIDPVGFMEKRQKLSKWLFFVIFDLF